MKWILIVLLILFLIASASAYPPELEEVSFSPTSFNTNYTGTVTISYLVNSSEPLNLSSLAFLYGVNYTIPAGGDMYNYISSPSNDIAYDGIYRSPYRNLTPYLSWEDNATITEGNVWQWGGYDNDSTEVSTNAINATHTWINVTGVTEDVLPSSFYLSKTAMYDAPKTGFEVSRDSGLIFKMWNLEEIRNRNPNYLANMYFDTSWESTEPTDPIEIGYCNFSYDPATDDIDVSPYCAKFGEWNGTRWVDHSFDPGLNASYASPLTINASQITDPIPTDINYVWLRSNTVSSKSFVLNATNYDPDITNRTFAQTETLWTYNELNGVTTAQAYTPSFFTTFARDDEELLHHIYIANDNGVWGHSEIFNESIGVSSVPVSPISFEYFNVTCEDAHHDEEMDATYNQGTIGVGLHTPADPDGGIVSYNLTLHYYPNQTLVSIINNTFTTTADEYLEIEVDTTPHYSSDTLYTLRCVSEDDEGSIAIKWLTSYFALDADGNRGWVQDSKLLFWGMNDIPTLYVEVDNSSLISYDGESGNYTMHIPFFKSKSNDTFLFDETVHLESLNNEDIAYFKFTGKTVFDNATIHGWNTTTDSLAPITDEYRAYVYSLSKTCGNITNSNFSYLGSNIYRQEGLNFVGSDYPYLIHNSTFSHNAEGPIFEECANFVISNCTISDNVNVGVGVYFTNNTVISNTSISSNAGYGISVYEGFNNTISYNDVYDNGAYGIRFWSGAGNNTCTGNDISGSDSYDYYYSGDSFGNYLIDPASSTNLIRVTGTSSLNIENTDNAAFSEDSLETAYAYPANFSMYVTDVSQTFNITQVDMTIEPSVDRVSFWNGVFGDAVTFNASSETSSNPTWFNITNSVWIDDTVDVYVNGTLEEPEINVSALGLMTFNYTDSWSEKYFSFTRTMSRTIVTLSNPTPSSGAEIEEGTAQPFTITSNVLCNSTWTLDGYEVDTDDLTMSPIYTIGNDLNRGAHSLEVISINAYNASAYDTYLWLFTIEAPTLRSIGSGGSGGVPTVVPDIESDPLDNVLCSENGFIRNIESNERTSYVVRDEECLLVTTVSYVATAKSSEQPIYIEALKDSSFLVTEDVPNYEILNFNLFVGFTDYESKSEQEKIFFKLRKTGIEEAGLDETSIKLYKWSADKETWIQKYTDMIDSDEYYYYYEADSGATTGRFAISGEAKIDELSLFSDLTLKLPGLGHMDFVIPEIVRIPIVEPFIKSIEDFVNDMITEYTPSLAPKEDTEIVGFMITANQETSTPNTNTNTNVSTIAALSLIFIAVLAFYFNSNRWAISMMTGILMIMIIYLFFGVNMINVFNSGLIDLGVNVIIITGISYMIPIAFKEAKEGI